MDLSTSSRLWLLKKPQPEKWANAIMCDYPIQFGCFAEINFNVRRSGWILSIRTAIKGEFIENRECLMRGFWRSAGAAGCLRGRFPAGLPAAAFRGGIDLPHP